MSKKENKKQIYKIETKTNIDSVREMLNEIFNESHDYSSKGKFIGSFKNDTFSGHTNYNTQIDLNGKIYWDKDKTIIDLKIHDCSPNFNTIINALFSVFFFLAIIITVSSKVTDIIVYLILIVVFGLGYLSVRIKNYLFKKITPNLKGIAKNITKKIDGEIINNTNEK